MDSFFNELINKFGVKNVLNDGSSKMNIDSTKINLEEFKMPNTHDFGHLNIIGANKVLLALLEQINNLKI